MGSQGGTGPEAHRQHHAVGGEGLLPVGAGNHCAGLRDRSQAAAGLELHPGFVQQVPEHLPVHLRHGNPGGEDVRQSLRNGDGFPLLGVPQGGLAAHQAAAHHQDVLPGHLDFGEGGDAVVHLSAVDAGYLRHHRVSPQGQHHRVGFPPFDPLGVQGGV